MTQTTAQIITSYGRRYTVRTGGGQCYDATTRAKRTDYACGDRVFVRILNREQAVIEALEPRSSLLYRQDAWKSKLIAANVSQLVIVTAADPTPSETFLQRALIAAEAAGILALIVLNKTDLPQTAAWRQQLAFYETLGYPVHSVCALHGAGSLKPLLHGHTNILLGQSGMGKSTLTNALLGSNTARTGSLSAALDSGRHTTTHAQLYDVDDTTRIIDSPGLQEFGLHHIPPADLPNHFPDLRHLIGHCRFHNCTHRAEPGCAFKAAADSGSIRPERLALLQLLTDRHSRQPKNIFSAL